MTNWHDMRTLISTTDILWTRDSHNTKSLIITGFALVRRRIIYDRMDLIKPSVCKFMHYLIRSRPARLLAIILADWFTEWLVDQCVDKLLKMPISQQLINSISSLGNYLNPKTWLTNVVHAKIRCHSSHATRLIRLLMYLFWRMDIIILRPSQ